MPPRLSPDTKIKNAMLMKDKISGVGTALVTPFTQAGEVDYAALKKIIEYNLSCGVDFLVAMGTTGESPVLSADEKREVCETLVEYTGGRVPLVMGIGGNCTASVVEQLHKTPLEAFSYVLSVAPYYNKPCQEGLYQHYKVIAENSSKPVIIYNIPSRCGVNVEPDTVLRLAREVKNVAAVKEASGNISNIGKILGERPAGFAVLSGDDSLTLPLMAMGADGVISTTANILPAQMVSMTRAIYAGDMEKAREIHYKIARAIRLLFEEGNPAGVKAALHVKDFCENVVRLPLARASENLYARIEREIQSIL